MADPWKKKVVKRGKFFRFTSIIDFGNVYAILKTDPKFRAKSMHEIGMFANRTLYREFLSHSEVNGTLKYTKKKDSRGRYMVRNTVVGNGRYNKVRMTSFPLNPFEFGREYRPPYKPGNRPVSRGPVIAPWRRRKAGSDPARGILTEKLPALLRAILPAKAQAIVYRNFMRMYT